MLLTIQKPLLAVSRGSSLIFSSQLYLWDLPVGKLSITSTFPFLSRFTELGFVWCMEDGMFNLPWHPMKRSRNSIQHRGPEACFTSTSPCYITLKLFQLMHSSIMPRMQLKSVKNKIKPLLQQNLVTQSPKRVTLSFRHTEPCCEHHVSCRCSTKQTALCLNATSGSFTPCMTDWSVSPLSLRTASWSECTNSEWVLRTLGRGYRLQFAVMPPQFRGVIQSEALGEAAHILQGRFLPC